MMKARLFEVVISVVREPAKGIDLEDEVWEDLVHVLRESNLLGTLGHQAEAHGVLQDYPTYAQRHLQSMRVYSDRQARQVRYECRLINDRLVSEGIRPVFLKGAGYTLRGSRNGLGRIYSDIDVLVDRGSIEQAQAALRRDAWYSPPITDYDERYYRKWAHEVPPMKHLLRRTVIDLHHNIVPPISGRAPDIGSLLKGVETTGEGMWVLSAPAATLHSLVHLFSNEDLSSGFRDLVDLYLLLEEYGDEHFWRELLALAEETGFVQELAFGVILLEMVLGYRVVEYARTELREPLASTSGSFVVKHVFRPALRPHHPLVCGGRENLAIQLAYVRGHWIKMPLPVLAGHLAVKAGMALGKKVFGKYRAAPVLEVPAGNHERG